MAEGDVLVVEDDRKVRDLLCQFLLTAGYNCLRASGGNEALKVFRESRPPLMVTQLILPHRLRTSVTAGLELLKQVRCEDPDLAVIVIGGAGHLKTLIECLKHGASAFLTLPLNLEEFLITAQRALERRWLLIERRRYRGQERSGAVAQCEVPILVVEEDAGVRGYFRDVFVGAGYRCAVASDWEEGLAAFFESRPALVVVDLGMPMAKDGNRLRDAGMTLLMEIRQGDPDAAVIVASGSVDVNLVTESLKLGAYAFLQKPVLVEELLITAERALEHRDLLIERRRHDE